MKRVMRRVMLSLLSRPLAIFLLVSSLAVHAQNSANKTEDDPIFEPYAKDPRYGAGYQTFFGSIETVAGVAVALTAVSGEHRSLVSVYQSVAEATQELDQARNVFRDEGSRLRAIQGVQEEIRVFGTAKQNAGPTPNALYARLAELERSVIVPNDEYRARRIGIALKKYRDAYAELESHPSAWKKLGMRSLKVVAVASGLIMMADAASRLYIYKTLKANPSASPVGTASWYWLRKALSESPSTQAVSSDAQSE